ncbi:hypothetical protein FJZ18_00225 [Candidatus Pacearchaeota archaeon]|nr:hypothetical protein [Candidatus Pacearchaeota archaeon]
MESKTIKVSAETYKWLARIAAELQKERGQPASFDDALDTLKKEKIKKTKLSDLAGAWNMSDKEWNKIQENLKIGWKKWKIPSV